MSSFLYAKAKSASPFLFKNIRSSKSPSLNMTVSYASRKWRLNKEEKEERKTSWCFFTIRDTYAVLPEIQSYVHSLSPECFKVNCYTKALSFCFAFPVLNSHVGLKIRGSEKRWEDRRELWSSGASAHEGLCLIQLANTWPPVVVMDHQAFPFNGWERRKRERERGMLSRGNSIHISTS